MIALAGIFVGGSGTRMGGCAKGLLRAPDGKALVERTSTILRDLGARAVLVGRAEAYERLRLEVVADEPPGIGPLGGLVALLRRAGSSPVLALACDMPFVSRALLGRLLATAPGAPIVAPRRQGRWEPLCARYDAPRVLPLAAERARSVRHSLQSLLDASGAAEMPLSPREAEDLRDWDSPEDMERTTP